MWYQSDAATKTHQNVNYFKSFLSGKFLRYLQRGNWVSGIFGTKGINFNFDVRLCINITSLIWSLEMLANILSIQNNVICKTTHGVDLKRLNFIYTYIYIYIYIYI